MNQKLKRHTLILSTFLGVALALAACKTSPEQTLPAQNTSAETESPSDSPRAPGEEIPAAETETGEISPLEVSQVHGYLDSYGAYRVVGLAKNNSDQIVDNIRVEVEIFGQSGELIHTDTVRTLLYTLTPGETSPFSLWVQDSLAGADHASGIAVSHDVSELNRAFVETRGVTVAIDEAGGIHVTGELYNSTSNPVQINGVAAATFDAEGELLTADSYSVGSRYLDPGEAGPFRVSMTGPSEGVAGVEETLIFVDAENTPPQGYFDLEFSDPQQYYVDSLGDFHLVGEITNRSDTSLNVELLAAVYDQNGNIIDVASTTLPLQAIAPETSLPYDFNTWGPLNSKAGYTDLAVRYSVQWDPYWTAESNVTYSDLNTDNETSTFDGEFGIFEGLADNYSNDTLNDVIVIVRLVDPQTGQTVATDYEAAFEELAAGDSYAYRVQIEMAPGLDMAALEVVITAKGELP